MPLKAFARALVAPVSRYLSRTYIAGPGSSDALAALDRFAGEGCSGTIGYFNPAAQAASEIADIQLRLLAALATRRGNGYVSIKAPPLRFDKALIGEIARRSAACGVALHFDSHGIAAADPTFASIDAAALFAPRLGCTLPARWPRSVADAERAVERKLRVRVVKGQWPDPRHPGVDIEAGYLDVVDRLAGRAHAVAVATHDPQLARRALRRLLDAGTPCELELLFGLPMRAASAAATEMGVPLRVYIPFGKAWLPYALSDLARHPGRISWLVKDALGYKT